MSAIGSFWFFMLAMIPLSQSLSSLIRLERLSEDMDARWMDEYQVRLCGSLAAAQANLKDAAILLSTEASDQTVEMTATLFDYYNEAAPSSPCKGTWLAARLHKEINPNLPRQWPNWIVLFDRVVP